MNKIKKLERQLQKAKDKLSELEKEIAQAHQEEGVDVPQQVCFTSNHKIMSADGWVAPLQPSFSQEKAKDYIKQNAEAVKMMLQKQQEQANDQHPDQCCSVSTDGFPKDDEHSLQQY